MLLIHITSSTVRALGNPPTISLKWNIFIEEPDDHALVIYANEKGTFYLLMDTYKKFIARYNFKPILAEFIKHLLI
jgi:hypothetical protein